MTLRRSRTLASCLTAALLCAPGSASASGGWKNLDIPIGVALSERPAAEAAMLADVNALRAAQGEPALEPDAELSALARAYARRMLEGRFVGHDAPDGSTLSSRMAQAGIAYRRVAENLSFTTGGEGDAFASLEASPPHLHAMLDKGFVRVGIGAIGIGVYGTMYVQEFTDG